MPIKTPSSEASVNRFNQFYEIPLNMGSHKYPTVPNCDQQLLQTKTAQELNSLMNFHIYWTKLTQLDSLKKTYKTSVS